jgi:hypothetical protein
MSRVTRLCVVEAVVRTVVERDLDSLSALTSADIDDLYEWTRFRPGAASDRDIDWVDLDGGGKHAVVTMWTRQEGRSDLSSESQMHANAAGQWRPEIRNLHVLQPHLLPM